jgi:group I intron endonuclease
MSYCIYKHTSPSGKSYIGQTNNYKRRCRQHRSITGNCLFFNSAIKKYGWDKFTHEVIAENLTIDEANYYEEFYIKEFKALYPNGYNLTTGGSNSLHSDETKEKIRIAAIGRVFSKETIEKKRIASTGRVHSKETKEKISIALSGENNPSFGVSPNESTREKIRLATIGRPRSEKAKENMNKKRFGRVLSDATKLKIGLANSGRTPSLETKQKISIAMKEHCKLKRLIKHDTCLHTTNRFDALQRP